jgi:hypothetical protein
LQKLAEANAAFHTNNYYELGFDDFYRTVVTLWTLTIVNNWFVFADAYAILMGSAAMVYFFLWYFFSVTYGTSVVTALFLVLFVREVESDKACQ